MLLFDRSNFIKFIYIILVIFAYIDFPFDLAGLVIPSFAPLCIAIPFSFFVMRDSIKRSELFFMVFLVLYLFFAFVFFGDFYNLGERAKSFLQIIFSLYVSYVSYVFLINRPLFFRELSRWMVIVIVVLSVFEVLGPLKILSDSFRGVVFSSDIVSYLYTSSERDLNLVGFERPSVFSAEPSFVSILFWVFSVALLKQDKRLSVFIIVFLLTVIMSYLLRSPIVYSLFLVSIYVVFLEQKLEKNYYIGIVFVALFFSLFVFFIADILSLVGRNLYSISYLFDYEINSQMLRFSVPFHTFVDVITVYPWFGVGLGGKDTVSAVSTLSLNIQKTMGTNSLLYSLIYFGLLGSFFYYSILFSFFRRVDRFFLVSILPIFFLYSNMLGGFVTLRYWFFLFILLAACKVVNRDGFFSLKK